MNKLIAYFRGSYDEMKKVTWPTKKETYNYSLLVIAVSLAMAIFLGSVDWLLNKGFESLISR